MKKAPNRLSCEEILAKKFKFQVGGYNTLEVDHFFDMVNIEIANLQDEYAEVVAQNQELKKALEQAKQEQEILKLELTNLKNIQK